MTRAFVSYSHDDQSFVESLIEDLNEYEDFEAVYDRKVLEGGDDLISLFGEIGRSDAVICVLSQSSIKSAFVGKEISSSIIKEIRENEFKFIPILEKESDFEEVIESMSDDLKTIILTYDIIRFDKDYNQALTNLISSLDKKADSGRIFNSATSEGADNPFSRTRTENLKDDRVAAHLFAKPEPQRYDKITEVKPTVIKGARGTGKTMVLKSLQSNINMMMESADTIKQSNLDRFGVYVRLSQGTFETQSEDVAERLDDEEMKIISMSEFILRLVESVIDEIQAAKKEGFIESDIEKEKSLINELSVPLDLSASTDTLDEVLRDINRCIFEIQNYVSNSIIDNDPTYQGTHLRRENLSYICEAVNSYLAGGNYTIYFLLDEYENLLEFQKEIVNTFIKWSSSQVFTFKVASKKPCFNNPNTLENQELEEPHDYGSVDLNYDLSDEKGAYKSLLKQITNNIFSERDISGLSVEEVLEGRQKYDDFEREEIINEIISMKDEDMEWWQSLDESRRGGYMNKYENAALYRLYDGNEATRDFGGFDELARLSSGIIRHFLELCSMSYYFEKDKSEEPLESGISIGSQTQGVENLSEYHLRNIQQNVDEYGPELYRLLLDIGDILEEKLLNHTSEPEAAIIDIADPDKINKNSTLNEVLYKAEEHSVLLKSSSREPKAREQPLPDTYLINRVYTPALGISPRYRWTTRFYSQDLVNLLDKETRIDTRDRLIRELAMGNQDTHQSKLGEDYKDE